MPEELPTPKKSLKQLEKENKKKFEENRKIVNKMVPRCGTGK